MTLLILAQPGAIIDIYWERLIVAVICLNYSRDQETAASQGTCHRGSCYTQTARQTECTPWPVPLYSKGGGAARAAVIGRCTSPDSSMLSLPGSHLVGSLITRQLRVEMSANKMSYLWRRAVTWVSESSHRPFISDISIRCIREITLLYFFCAIN